MLTGDAWETYIQKNILSPLGLARSYFGTTPYYLAPDRSHNYYARIDSATKRDTLIDNGTDFDPGITIPNGGWNAPLADLEAYLAFLTNATHGDTALQARYALVLPHRDLEEMWQPYFPPSVNGADSPSRDRGIESTGISFFVVRRDGSKLIGHTGEQAGFTSFIYLNPATSDAVVAAFNTVREDGNGSAPSSFLAIRDAALDLLMPGRTPAAPAHR